MAPKISKKSLYKQMAQSSSSVTWWNTLFDNYDIDASFATLKSMRAEDAQVFAGISVKVLATLSKGYDVHYSGKDSRGDEIVAFLKNQFESVNDLPAQIPGLDHVLAGQLDDLITYGVSAIEPVHYLDRKQGKIGLKKLFRLEPKSIEKGIKKNKLGDIESITQWVGYGDGQIPITPEKLVLWLDESQLISIYKNWFIKTFVMKFWNIALERYGTPLLIGTVRKEEYVDDMHDLLDSVRTKTALSVTDGDKVEKIDIVTEGDNFKNAILYHDTMILRGLMVPTLLLGQEDVGARSLGDTHIRVFLWAVRTLQKQMTAVWQSEINLLTTLNYGEIDEFPKLTFPEFDVHDMKSMAETYKILIDAGIIDPDEPWIRKEISIPERKPGTAPKIVKDGGDANANT